MQPERNYQTIIKTIYDPFVEGEPPIVEIIDLTKLNEKELEKLSVDYMEARLELIYRSFQG
jgi:hypothetical protein